MTGVTAAVGRTTAPTVPTGATPDAPATRRHVRVRRLATSTSAPPRRQTDVPVHAMILGARAARATTTSALARAMTTGGWAIQATTATTRAAYTAANHAAVAHAAVAHAVVAHAVVAHAAGDMMAPSIAAAVAVAIHAARMTRPRRLTATKARAVASPRVLARAVTTARAATRVVRGEPVTVARAATTARGRRSIAARAATTGVVPAPTSDATTHAGPVAHRRTAGGVVMRAHALRAAARARTTAGVETVAGAPARTIAGARTRATAGAPMTNWPGLLSRCRPGKRGVAMASAPIAAPRRVARAV